MSTTRRNFIAGSVALAAGTGLVGCSSGSEDSPAGGDATSLRLATDIALNTWDPAQADSNVGLEILQAAYDSLLLREADGTLAPMLATSWTWNSDRTVLSLALRDDVKFSDGEAFTAAAVKANIENFQKAGGPLQDTMAGITEVTVKDDHSVDLVLSAPDPTLEVNLAGPAGLVVSPRAIGSADLANAPVGSGPYVLDTAATVAASSYVLTKNATYWNTALQKYDGVTWTVMEDNSAVLNALKSGQIDGGQMTQVDNAVEAKASGLTVVGNELDWAGMIIFDRAGELVPALGDARVRQAIGFAFDRPAMLKGLRQGEGTVTTQIFPPASGGFDATLDDYYTYDVAQAKALLTEAGYADGFAITMPTHPIFSQAQIATVGSALKDIGITVTWEDPGASQFFDALLAGKYGMSMMQFAQTSDWQLLNQMVLPTATWNVEKTEEPRFTPLAQQIQLATDEADAAAGQINQILVEDAWYLPWFRIKGAYAVNSTTSCESQFELSVPALYNFAPQA